jgi:lipopolysaccharide transport system ATP-binding protein
MSAAAVLVEQLGKEYAFGGESASHDTLYDLLAHALQRFRARPPRPSQASADKFWALRDVDFRIEPGEVVGVIGRNGAGKSTLLKVLSRITAPTRGRAQIRGRLASLLEVGTGFHPELTGRENIFLNGAILGMARSEVARKFDEIVSFAEVERFVDTPVKHYSSGMYVRLAFAVAAHLETDVLLVDEVLAVGDALFQRKSLGKMGDAARSGRTVLFVSHNLGAVRSLCSRAMLFERGRLAFDGAVEEGIATYEKTFAPGGLAQDAQFEGSLRGDLHFQRLACLQGGQAFSVLDPQQDFELHLEGVAARDFASFELKLSVFRDGIHIGSLFDAIRPSALQRGPFRSAFRIAGGVFRPGRYTLGIGVSAGLGAWLWGGDVAVLDFSDNPGGHSAERNAGVISIPHEGSRTQ